MTLRPSDTTAELTQDFIESGCGFIKPKFQEGEVDFVASPNLVVDFWEAWGIEGPPVMVETASKSVAKKLYHRGDRATTRDLFDLALVVEREPDALRLAAPLLVNHGSSFLGQVREPHCSLLAVFDAIAVMDYQPSYAHCVAIAGDFLERV